MNTRELFEAMQDEGIKPEHELALIERLGSPFNASSRDTYLLPDDTAAVRMVVFLTDDDPDSNFLIELDTRFNYDTFSIEDNDSGEAVTLNGDRQNTLFQTFIACCSTAHWNVGDDLHIETAGAHGNQSR